MFKRLIRILKSNFYKCNHEYTLVHKEEPSFLLISYRYHLYCPLCDKRKIVKYDKWQIIKNSQEAKKKFFKLEDL